MRLRPSIHTRARARASAGAALLDLMAPGWWRKIRIRRLDINDQCNCVTGQLFGDYDKGLNMLGLTEQDARKYGFLHDSDDPGTTHWTLTQAWRNELRARRYGATIGRQP